MSRTHNTVFTTDGTTETESCTTTIFDFTGAGTDVGDALGGGGDGVKDYLTHAVDTYFVGVGAFYLVGGGYGVVADGAFGVEGGVGGVDFKLS